MKLALLLVSALLLIALRGPDDENVGFTLPAEWAGFGQSGQCSVMAMFRQLTWN